MGVGLAPQAGMAEVAIRVVRLLQRAKHKRCIRLATVTPALGLPGDQAARLSGKLARLLGGDRVRQRRRRNVEGSELLDHPANPLRVRLLVHPVDGRDAAALEELGDTLVREDHQVLDQPVGLGLRDRVGAGHPSVLEAELRLEALHLERGAGAAPGESRGRLSGEGQRLGDRPWRPGTAREDLVELVVVETRVRADQAAVEAGRKRLAGLRELDLRGDRQAIPLGERGCTRRSRARAGASVRPGRERRWSSPGGGPPSRGALPAERGPPRRRCGSRGARRARSEKRRRRRRSRGRSPDRR